MLTRRGFLKFVLRGAILAAAMVGYPLAEVMARPRITGYTLTPPNWTPGSS